MLSSVLSRLVLIILNQVAIEEIQKMTLWLFNLILLSCNKIYFKEKKTHRRVYQNWILYSLQLPQGQISTYIVFIIMQLMSHNVCRYGDNKIMIAGITKSVFLTCFLEWVAGVEVVAKWLLKGEVSEPIRAGIISSPNPERQGPWPTIPPEFLLKCQSFLCFTAWIPWDQIQRKTINI